MEGKIIRLIAGNYQVESAGQIYDCKATGKFRHEGIKPLVGDNVIFDPKHSYITGVKSRKNAIIRPAIANIDQALILTTVKEPDFGSYITNKLITLTSVQNIEPIIVFTKMDLDPNFDIEIINDYKRAGYKTFAIGYDNEDFLEILPLLKDKVTVIAGQTGSGKSTLVNRFDPTLNIATQEISKALNRGKHTTRHTELHKVGGGLLADTPGFSSFEMINVSKDQLKDAFKDFAALGVNCKFNNCIHINEPGCEVKRHVGKTINETRYKDYVKIIEEIDSRKERY